MVGGGFDGVVLRGVGLDDDAAAEGAAPSTAGEGLVEELEGAFAGAEVGEMEGDVRGDDADECDERDVEALRYHLGADEDVRLVGQGNFARMASWPPAGCG